MTIRDNATRNKRQFLSHLICVILLISSHAKTFYTHLHNFCRISRIGKTLIIFFTSVALEVATTQFLKH